MRAAMKKQDADLDPLYVIFEQHLYNFEDSDQDRKTFIATVIHDYITYLRKLNIAVPMSLERPIVEELATHVNTMLVKKIYGCLSLRDYQKNAPAQLKRKARSRYKKLTQKAG